jgi:DnaJ-class molecular chaperone
VAVPKWSNTGRVLRLKGRGVPRSDGSKGDQYIKLMLMLMLMLPEKPDPKLEAFVAEWQPVAYSPRQSMGV